MPEDHLTTKSPYFGMTAFGHPRIEAWRSSHHHIAFLGVTAASDLSVMSTEDHYVYTSPTLTSPTLSHPKESSCLTPHLLWGDTLLSLHPSLMRSANRPTTYSVSWCINLIRRADRHATYWHGNYISPESGEAIESLRPLPERITSTSGRFNVPGMMPADHQRT